jgi:hypothetical protein
MRTAPKAFAVTGGKGVHLTFSNGYSISIQWGPGNYCDHYHKPFDRMSSEACGSDGSDTAEVAVFKDGNWVNPPIPEWETGDDVCGWRNADDVAAIIAWVVAQRG